MDEIVDRVEGAPAFGPDRMHELSTITTEQIEEFHRFLAKRNSNPFPEPVVDGSRLVLEGRAKGGVRVRVEIEVEDAPSSLSAAGLVAEQVVVRNLAASVAGWAAYEYRRRVTSQRRER